MGILYALAGSFRQQWKVSLSSQQHLDWLLGILPQIFIVLWMAGQSDDRTVFDYVAVGSLFWVLWTMTVFRIGSSLTHEFYEGTLEAGLTSRTPLMLIILGKAAAVMVLSLIASTLVMVVVLGVLQHWIDIASIPLLIVSVGFVTLALFATGFIFAPAMVLLQGRGGFYQALIPFGIVFTGMLYPVRLLPDSIEPIARFIPTSWAMESVMRSMQTGSLSMRMAGDWATTLALTLLFMGLTYLMFRVVERRIRVNGSLGTF